MKYIITESRLVGLVDNFINSYIGGDLEKQHGSSDNNFIYVNSKGDAFFETKPLGNLGHISLGIDRDLFTTIKQLFSLSRDNVYQVLVKWFGDKYDIFIHPDHTYTFNL
jgi:hypothetical protein